MLAFGTELAFAACAHTAHVLFSKPLILKAIEMGKRKLHGNTYFQCDWTGLPMRNTNCYMPGWNENGKLVKHGSYCCWEAVMAHATQMSGGTTHLEKIREYVNELVGCTVECAPSWEKLAWFAREEPNTINTPDAFLNECMGRAAPIVAVRLPSEGVVHEVICSLADTQMKFVDHLTRPFNMHGPLHTPQSFQTVRKKGNKERDLTVFYWPFKNGLQFNQTASNLFKMQIYGDVLLVQQSKEPCFLPRERYVNYFQTMFLEQFSAKNKRKDISMTLSTDEFAVAKAQMASELQAVEALASSSSSVPSDLAHAANLPPPSGSELADLLHAQGQPRPKKKLRLEASPLSSACVEAAA